MDFNRAGDKAYLLGNSGMKLDKVDPAIYEEDEFDLLMVLNITAPGEVTWDEESLVNLGRHSGSQLFGVDNIVVDKGKAYASYSNLSVDKEDLRVITVVDLETREVTRLGADGMVTGLAKVPIKSLSAEVPAGTNSCVGLCGSELAGRLFYANGVNKAASCFCDNECLEWGDCCSDYESQCLACDPTACTCANLDDGTFACGCSVGSVDNGSGGCDIVDPCAAEGGDQLCGDVATCAYDADIGYKCVCPDGFRWDGMGGCRCTYGYRDDGTGVCVDIDECTDGINACQSSATCKNTDGSYDCDCTTDPDIGLIPDGFGGCACQSGYEIGDAGVCVDIDECTEGTNNCVSPATCTNTDYSFTCDCPEGTGYQSDHMGGCVCSSGYTDTGSACEDIDECELELADCGDLKCVNTSGSYTCE